MLPWVGTQARQGDTLEPRDIPEEGSRLSYVLHGFDRFLGRMITTADDYDLISFQVLRR